MIVNGEKIELEKEVSISEFLTSQGYDLARVAVEKNGDVVPKKSFDEVTVSDGDKIEIVHFVGGG
jgi:thiamine biosynthesis protein ThiS